MSERYAYGDEARWLLSDGQIIGKTTFSPHSHGIQMDLTLPDGESMSVAFKKKDIHSMTTFCEMARSTFNERKAEQEAKAARAANARLFDESGPEPDTGEADVQVPQTSVPVDFSSRQSVTDRIDAVSATLLSLAATELALNKELQKLVKIEEVLRAFEDDGEELPSVSGQEGTEDPVQMDQSPREHEVHAGREGDLVGEGEVGLESLPDAESESGEDSGLKQEADVYTSSL